MALAVVGISHHTAPIEVRERFVFSREQATDALAGLASRPEVEEAVLLSTCNRTEIYVHLKLPEEGDRDAAAARGLEAVERLLAERAGLSHDDAQRWLYTHRQRRVAEHLFRVATSLDSMVVGEAQIQGQVREAYAHASDVMVTARPAAGTVLSRLFQAALGVGGRVRAETGLGRGAASVPSAALELAKKIFGPLAGRRALVLGAGDMAELAVQSFAAEGVHDVLIVNRSAERAETVAARLGGRPVEYAQLAAVLDGVDIVVASTAAPHLVLTRELVDEAMPRGPREPMLIVDIALPRDVEPSVGEVDNIFLYDIDDLQQIVDANLERRRHELPRAEELVQEAASGYWSWYAGRDLVPVIRSLRHRAEEVRRQEVERLLRRLDHLGAEEREAIDVLTRQLVAKLMHAPTARLREAGGDGDGAAIAAAARYLFDLSEDAEEE